MSNLKRLKMVVLASGIALMPFLAHGVSLSQAVAKVKQQTDGRVVSAETVSKGGGEIHRIRVLTDTGRVKLYQIDAADSGLQQGRR